MTFIIIFSFFLDMPAATYSDSLREGRLLTLLTFMDHYESRVDVLLEMMRRSTLPWSNALDSLIQQSLGWPLHRRKEELHEQYRLMQLKKTLLKYDILSFNVSDTLQAKGNCRFVVWLYHHRSFAFFFFFFYFNRLSMYFIHC